MSTPPAYSATPWSAYACLAGSMALVGGYVGFSKLLVAVFPVFLLAWFRFGIAALAMLGWVRRRPDEPALSVATPRLLFLGSFLGNVLFSVCMLFGIAMTSALAAGVIMAAIPAAVALMSHLFLRERVAPRVVAGIACAIAGIALVSATGHGGHSNGGSRLGNLLLLGAVLCEASYVVIGKTLSQSLGPKRISALINLWGLGLMTPLGLWQALSFDYETVTANLWALLVFYAIAASMVTVWLWMTGLRRVPASSAGVFTVMLPISAAAVGVAFLGERFSAMQAAAFVLAIAGVVLATWPARSAHSNDATRSMPPKPPRNLT